MLEAPEIDSEILYAESTCLQHISYCLISLFLGTAMSAVFLFTFLFWPAFRSFLTASVVRVPGYRFRDPGSIPSATRFSEK
jgi:hypothetical protein